MSARSFVSVIVRLTFTQRLNSPPGSFTTISGHLQQAIQQGMKTSDDRTHYQGIESIANNVQWLHSILPSQGGIVDYCVADRVYRWDVTVVINRDYLQKGIGYFEGNRLDHRLTVIMKVYKSQGSGRLVMKDQRPAESSLGILRPNLVL
ncbi:hypothetical protein J6590_087567 [Homalodisca vitripennis]|nr:hypothetical protein J6590_087567 [Homalodisca vitripennis]